MDLVKYFQRNYKFCCVSGERSLSLIVNSQLVYPLCNTKSMKFFKHFFEKDSLGLIFRNNFGRVLVKFTL